MPVIFFICRRGSVKSGTKITWRICGVLKLGPGNPVLTGISRSNFFSWKPIKFAYIHDESHGYALFFGFVQVGGIAVLWRFENRC